MGDKSGSDDETGSSSATGDDSDAEDGQGAAAGHQDARAASTRAKDAALAVLEGEAPCCVAWQPAMTRGCLSACWADLRPPTFMQSLWI